MCSSPVMLGGGSGITNGGLPEFGSALKASASIQRWNWRGSTEAGS